MFKKLRVNEKMKVEHHNKTNHKDYRLYYTGLDEHKSSELIELVRTWEKGILEVHTFEDSF